MNSLPFFTDFTPRYVPGVPLDASNVCAVVVPVLRSDWLGLRLRQPVPGCDWWIALGPVHAARERVRLEKKTHMVHESSGSAGTCEFSLSRDNKGGRCNAATIVMKL